jgi:hypothetical protein
VDAVNTAIRLWCRLVFVLNTLTIALATYGAVTLGRFEAWEVIPWSMIFVGVAISTEVALYNLRRLRIEDKRSALFAMRVGLQIMQWDIDDQPQTRLLSREEYEDYMNATDDTQRWLRDAGKWPNPWPWNELPRRDDDDQC